MRIDRRMDSRQERLQILGSVAREIDCQKVIEEDICDHAGIVPVLRNENAAKRSNGRMGIGERVDAAVIADAFRDSGRKVFADPPLDEIARQVSDHRFGVALCKEQVREIVHAATIADGRWLRMQLFGKPLNC